jgi:hypothetical protein
MRPIAISAPPKRARRSPSRPAKHNSSDRKPSMTPPSWSNTPTSATPTSTEKINILDYTLIDQGIAAGLRSYSNGDFNYDGKIDILDYVLIDANLPIQGPPL